MAPPQSHRVDDPIKDEGSYEGLASRSDKERASTSQPSSQMHSHHHPLHGHPYGIPPYYNSPVVYHPPPRSDPYCHYCSGGHGHYGHGPNEQYPHYSPAHRDSANQHERNHPAPQVPQYQPHYVAVNVQNEVSQSQNQRQNQMASNQQMSLKHKVIHHTSKALESILDKKVMLAGLTAFIVPRVMGHIQATTAKKKRKGITLNLGFGGF